MASEKPTINGTTLLGRSEISVLSSIVHALEAAGQSAKARDFLKRVSDANYQGVLALAEYYVDIVWPEPRP